MTDVKPLVSIVCPVFNEEDCVPLFFQRLQATLPPLWRYFEFELIFTNNASTDRTLEKILAIRAANPWVYVVTLSRNFGYQDALATFAAAVTHARAAHRDRTDTGHDLAIGQMPVAH